MPLAEPYTSRPTLYFRAKSLVPPSFRDATIISIVALIVSLILFGLFMKCSGVSPFDVYHDIYQGAFGTAYSWRNTLIHAAPIMLTALCVALPARVGMVIIGGEGCVLLGGLMAALVAHLMPNSGPYLVIPMMIIGGMCIGGIWTAIAGALKQFRGVNEVISSLLLNYIALAILNHCVEGPLHDPTSLDHPSSWPIGDANTLSTIGDFIGRLAPNFSSWVDNLPADSWKGEFFQFITGATFDIHYGIVYGIIACIFCWVLMDRTRFGFAAKIVGGNQRAAKVAGLNIVAVSMITCFLGGAFAALTGVVEVAAVQHHANDSLACGYGYAGILVAFVARQNPLAIIPVAILLGGVSASGDLLQADLGISSASVQVFQGILFLTILGLDTWAGRLHEVKNAWFMRVLLWPLKKMWYGKGREMGVAHASV